VKLNDCLYWACVFGGRGRRTRKADACNVARVSCNVAGVSCNVGRATCNVARVSCNVAGVSCNVANVSCTVARVSFNVAGLSCNVAGVSYNAARVFCNISLQEHVTRATLHTSASASAVRVRHSRGRIRGAEMGR